MLTTHETHADLAIELTQSAWTLGLIRRARQDRFVSILGTTDTRVDELLFEIANLEEEYIEGEVEIHQGKKVSAFSLIQVVSNIIAAFIARTLDTEHGLLRENNDLEMTQGRERKLRRAFALLPALQAADNRWPLVEAAHRKKIIGAGLALSGLVRNLPILVEDLHAWRRKRRR